MNVNSMGGMPLASRVQTPQRKVDMGGVNARRPAENEMAQSEVAMSSARSSEPTRPSVEARGMFVDTYA